MRASPRLIDRILFSKPGCSGGLPRDPKRNTLPPERVAKSELPEIQPQPESWDTDWYRLDTIASNDDWGYGYYYWDAMSSTSPSVWDY